MKLAVSNIAWDTSRMEEYLGLLALTGCQGMEISPSMIWPEPITAAPKEIYNLKKFIESFGLEIPSMHSLTYPRPDLVLFGPQETRLKLIEYIVQLGRLASQLECPVMVFGSAKSREIGSNNRLKCFEIMTEAFSHISDALKIYGVSLLIEPLSKLESDCINSCEEGMDLIEAVDQDNFKLHVDLRSSFEEKENYEKVWTEFASTIGHCHVADPSMQPPSAECSEHFIVAPLIRESSYDGYLSLEVKRTPDGKTEDLEKSIRFVQQTYFSRA